MTVSSSGMGQLGHTSWVMILGGTACGASQWVSDTSITCLTVAEVGGTAQVMVMSGVKVGNMTEAASYDEPASAVLRQAANRPSTAECR